MGPTCIRLALGVTAVAFAALAWIGPAALAEDPPKLSPRGKSKEYREALKTISTLAKAKKPSVASGMVTDGKLHDPAELPAKGFGYKLASPKRKTHFGTDEMVFGLIELAALLQEKHPGSPWLSIGDISGPEGGKLEPHMNHQDGQDLDLAFFYCTAKGEPADRGWLKCEETGKTKSGVVFDVARNFELLWLWLESPIFGGCEWILVYEPLEKLLVAHGHELAKKHPKSAEKIEQVTAELEELMREPSSSPHADHFHIRLKRSPDDRAAGAGAE